MVVEAIQFRAGPDELVGMEHIQELEKFLGATQVILQATSGQYSVLILPTIVGEMKVSDGDWIIRGADGVVYPCKDPDFRKIYVPDA